MSPKAAVRCLGSPLPLLPPKVGHLNLACYQQMRLESFHCGNESHSEPVLSSVRAPSVQIPFPEPCPPLCFASPAAFCACYAAVCWHSPAKQGTWLFMFHAHMHPGVLQAGSSMQKRLLGCKGWLRPQKGVAGSPYSRQVASLQMQHLQLPLVFC